MEPNAKTQKQNKSRGYSLIEVAIAMALLSVLSIGLLNGTLQTREITEENIYHSAAVNATVGYLEQMKSLPYTDIQQSLGSPFTMPLDTVIDYDTKDPIYLNTWNYKSLTINTDDEGDVIESMDFWVWPYVEDLSPTYNQPALAMRLAYAWRSPVTARFHFSNLKIVRSSVVTY
jgi:prepilin-type N-terminal cleavage/methylation domain-containing protein